MRKEGAVNAVIRGEWIGKEVKVVSAANPSSIGLKGEVVDETKNLLVLETASGERKVPKHLSVFRIRRNDMFVDVSGDDILASPEERIKK